MRIDGPDQAIVGQRLPFEVVITNGGAAAATGLLLRNEFDDGLVHEATTSPMETDIRSIPAGGSERVQIILRADRAGRLCQRLQLFGNGTLRAAKEKCTEVVGSAQPAGISVRKWIPAQGDGPYTAQLNETVEFQIDVTNNSSAAVSDLVLVEHYSEELDPINATDGYQFDDQLNLTWRLGALAAGQTKQYRVQCNCPVASRRRAATVHLSATSRATLSLRAKRA